MAIEGDATDVINNNKKTQTTQTGSALLAVFYVFNFFKRNRFFTIHFVDIFRLCLAW